MRFQPQVHKPRVRRVVVVRLSLDPGILEASELRFEVQGTCDFLDEAGQFQYRPLLGKLVEDPELTWPGGIVRRQLYAAHRITNVYEATCLTTLAVDRDGVSRSGLGAEAVEGRPEDPVVVVAVRERRVGGCLLGLHVVDDALIEVGGPQTPGAAGEHNVVRVVDLGVAAPDRLTATPDQYDAVPRHLAAVDHPRVTLQGIVWVVGLLINLKDRRLANIDTVLVTEPRDVCRETELERDLLHVVGELPGRGVVASVPLLTVHPRTVTLHQRVEEYAELVAWQRQQLPRDILVVARTELPQVDGELCAEQVVGDLVPILERVSTVGTVERLGDAPERRDYPVGFWPNLLVDGDAVRGFFASTVNGPFGYVPSQETQPVVHGNLDRWSPPGSVPSIQVVVRRQDEGRNFFPFPVAGEMVAVVFVQDLACDLETQLLAAITLFVRGQHPVVGRDAQVEASRLYVVHRPLVIVRHQRRRFLVAHARRVELPGSNLVLGRHVLEEFPAASGEDLGPVVVAEVVEGARLLGVRQGILAALVLDRYIPLFDVYVRGAVLAHRTELYQVALRRQLANGEEEV